MEREKTEASSEREETKSERQKTCIRVCKGGLSVPVRMSFPRVSHLFSTLRSFKAKRRAARAQRLTEPSGKGERSAWQGGFRRNERFTLCRVSDMRSVSFYLDDTKQCMTANGEENQKKIKRSK